MWRVIVITGGLAGGCVASTGAQIGPEGGVLRLDGVSLDVPAGALSQETQITLRRDDRIETESPGLTGVFAFEPAMLQLAIPAEVSFEIDGDVASLALKWSEDGDAWARLTSTQGDGTVVAQIDHLGWGLLTEDVVE